MTNETTNNTEQDKDIIQCIIQETTIPNSGVQMSKTIPCVQNPTEEEEIKSLIEYFIENHLNVNIWDCIREGIKQSNKETIEYEQKQSNNNISNLINPNNAYKRTQKEVLRLVNKRK